MKFRNLRETAALAALAIGLLAGHPLHAQEASAAEDHELSILGIKLGMNPQETVDRTGGRMPDGRQDEKDVVKLVWKLEGGNVLQVHFRKERVVHIGLQYKNPRPTTNFWLAPLSSPASSSGLTASDPRLRRDYQATETRDKERAVWVRQEKSPAGYRVDIQFLSGARKQYGERFWEYVEFKYVSVAKDDLKKFEQTAEKPEAK